MQDLKRYFLRSVAFQSVKPFFKDQARFNEYGKQEMDNIAAHYYKGHASNMEQHVNELGGGGGGGGQSGRNSTTRGFHGSSTYQST